MNSYVEAIQTAVLIFPFVALLFTLPYMAVQYRKYGAILALRTAIIYSFILYLMCACFLTVLPLPSFEKVRAMTTETYRVIPFYDVWETLINAEFNLLEPASYLRVLKSSGFFQIVANIAMLVPFGIYLRYYFGCSLRKTVLFSFCLSLVFELTQLTGLFFIYPRPYRLFEVDDLINNTLGGLIGYWIAPLLMKVLPGKERMDTVAYKRGTYVSFLRRLCAAVIDWIILGFLVSLWIALDDNLKRLLANQGMRHWLFGLCGLYAFAVLVYFILGEWAWKGRTPGKRLLRIRLVDRRDNSRPKFWQCFVRYAVLYWVIAPTPLILMLMITIPDLTSAQWDWVIVGGIALLAVYALFWLLVVINLFTRSIHLLHEKISRTGNMSTLLVTEDMLGSMGGDTCVDAEKEELEEAEPPEDILNE